MESENSHSINTTLQPKDIAQFRKRYRNLTLLFKFFFITLILIVSALFIYLVQDIASDYDQNPVSETESRNSLRTAADELEDVASFILFNHLGSNAVDADTESAFKSCWRSMHNGSARIREALESGELVGRMDLVRFEAGEGVKACVGDLEKVESTAAIEVRAKVLRAQVRLSGEGDFLGSVWRELSRAVAGAWDGVCVFFVCLCGIQLLFICYLLWGVMRFR